MARNPYVFTPSIRRRRQLRKELHRAGWPAWRTDAFTSTEAPDAVIRAIGATGGYSAYPFRAGSEGVFPNPRGRPPVEAVIGGRRVPVLAREVTKSGIRLRLARRSDFAPGSFRTVKLSRGRRLVIGCPKGAWDASGGYCRVGTRAQALIRPRKRNPVGIPFSYEMGDEAEVGYYRPVVYGRKGKRRPRIKIGRGDLEEFAAAYEELRRDARAARR